jgi:hypothetical protein
MTRQLTCSSTGKVEVVDGCVALIPKEVNEQRYLPLRKVRHILFVGSQILPPEFDVGVT